MEGVLPPPPTEGQNFRFHRLDTNGGERFPTFAEDGSENFGNGEDIHAMGNVEGDVIGDPIGGFEGATLMT